MPINRNGAVTTGTLANLIEGVRSAPMSQAAVEAVLEQATQVATMLTDVYSTHIADGEVGAEGSGRASSEPILASRPPRALLYGRIQSGKTVSMILSTAICLDNGFRVIVVLTTDNVALVRQTANRFKDLDGPRVFCAHKEGPAYEWVGQEDELRESLDTDGIVLVCAKNAFNLPEVIRFLQQLDASNYPVLVLDDEADAASLDTTIAARSAGKPSAPSYGSTINRLIVANDKPREVGFSLGEELPHSLYVQVTATPYVLFLQKEDADLRPTETYLLEPGQGYCGGEVFFGDFDPEKDDRDQPTNIVIVGANEGATMQRTAPLGLAQSVNYFILAACARANTSGWPTDGFKHLAHTSHKTDDHEIVAGYIETHLNRIRRTLRGDLNVAQTFFADAYNELQRSIETPPPLGNLINSIRSAMRHAEVHRINSKVDNPVYGPRLNFLVGGNILGRGLTIDDLLVTYYVREARTSQMDTVWQHARMYGYRRSYLDYIRIYLPKRLATRFKEIHEAEEALRTILQENSDDAAVLIRVPGSSRPTRPNALESGAVQTLRAGRDQVHPHFLQHDPGRAAEIMRMLVDEGVPVSNTDRDQRATRIPLTLAKNIVTSVPIQEDDPGLWSDETVLALLDEYASDLDGHCMVYVRQLQAESPPDGGWWRGRLGGPEIALLRTSSSNLPALALLHAGDPHSPTAWYPTLVMPSGSPTYVFTAD